MRLLIIISLCLSIIAGSAYADDAKLDVQIVLAQLQSVELSQTRPSERYRTSDYGDDEIVVTNACGKFKAQFDVLASTDDKIRKLKQEGNIGEWCKTPYALQYTYLFLVSKNGIEEVIDVFADDDGNAVIPMDLNEKVELEQDYNLPAFLNIKTFSKNIYADGEEYDLNSQDRSWLIYEPNLKIVNYEGDEYLAYKTGVYLKDIFKDFDP